MATLFDLIQVRRGTAAAWTAANPTLAQGEIGFEYDTGRIKIGDGLTAWNSLLYYPTVINTEWTPQVAAFTYVGATQFTTPGNVTANYPTGIRLKAVVTAGTIYGTVTNQSSGGSPVVTTVTVSWDSGSLDAGLSAVSIGIFSPTNTSVPPQFFLQTGVLLPYAGSTAPTGFLLCYGQAVSRATYANLFAICGTAFGAGNGSTTFNIPDMRGRGWIGLDNMGGGAASRVALAITMGYSAGFESLNLAHTHTTGDHALTVPELPSHSHTVTSAVTGTSGGAGGGATPFPAWAANQTSSVGGSATHNHGATASSLSSTQESMPPFVTGSWIIKY